MGAQMSEASFIGSRNDKPSGKGCVVNDQTTMAFNK